MAFFPGLKMRFQHWAVAVLLGFVLILTGLLLTVVIGKFNEMAEDSAKERFSLIARSGAEGLRDLIEVTARQVRAHAMAKRERFVADGRLNDRDMLVNFISHLESEENLYSVYFALESDDFLQVINIKDNPRVLAALSAPPHSRYALRKIVRSESGGREEAWQFWSSEREIIAARKGETDYFPTRRPWYEGASKAAPVAITEPYIFASSQALGITISSPLRDGIGVAGADLSLSALRQFLSGVSLTPESAIVVLDREDRILAFHSKSPAYGLNEVAVLTPIASTASAHLAVLKGWRSTNEADDRRIIEVGGEKFVYANYLYNPVPGIEFRIGAFAPMHEFTGVILEARNRVLYVTLAFLLLVTPLAVVGARRVGRLLSALAADSERIKNLDFYGEVRQAGSILYEVDALGQAHRVMKDTLKQRTRALSEAEQKLASLVENGILLSRERDRQKLLRHILFGGRELIHCDSATMYLKTEQGTLKFVLRTMDGALPSFELPLIDKATGKPNDKYVSVHVALHNESVVIDDVYSEQRFDLSGTRRFAEESGYRTVSMLTVPMSPHDGEVIGVLQFMNCLDPETGQIIPFPRGMVRFVEALAAQSAVALENQNLLESQKALMDSMIKLVAGAIDTKSPYTGGHCERVPELANMLAEEAEQVETGPLADFRFLSDEERREFHVGAWLHDCGKVTTPEYVVDKATKLETIYNRIHEVRVRFEVLLRDAEIECLKAISAGADAAEARRRFDERRARLIDDFAFVAECNMGGEFMAPERVERIKLIARQTWERHFDDRIGLSHEELKRYEGTPVASLPATEHLLADRPHHIIARGEDKALDPKYGFKVKIPEHLYNFGEVYNLCIGRGTLSEEERFKINEHIIQTIVMLDAMPFPKELRRVPEYAGTHHETLVGTGYPRRLTKDELSVPARIMAIADIFEALTASDRPYKKAKTLSEAVKILAAFKKDKHIDPDLFDLFLRSGVYMRYAQRYLKPEQIDSVDISQYVD
jgi:HD-GYP domain-containing protein (c-di-GMP phosphodiesterase class II)